VPITSAPEAALARNKRFTYENRLFSIFLKFIR
jgi:hypothetical protein